MRDFIIDLVTYAALVSTVVISLHYILIEDEAKLNKQPQTREQSQNKN